MSPAASENGAARGARGLVIAVAILVAGGILGAQLFRSPIVGLADNGDFLKVMEPAGLAYTTDLYGERYWQWTLTRFAIVPPGKFPGEYKTSETLLALAAASGSRLFGSGRTMDIRALGAVHSLLFLLSIALLGRAADALSLLGRALVLGLAVFFFTDVGYTAPFNSLYSQTASLLFLFLVLAIAAIAIRRGRLDGWLLFAYFGCAALFVCSKPQESIQGPLLALLGLRLAGTRRRGCARDPAAWAAIALCVTSIGYYRMTPRRSIGEVGLYHTVFMELLPLSPNPARDLAELGLAPDLAMYSGVTAYAANAPLGDPAFRSQYFERLGYRDVLQFYVTHPERLVKRLWRSGRRAFELRPGNLANFDQRSGYPPMTLSRTFDTWSSLRSTAGLHGGLLWIAVLLGGNLFAAARLLPKTTRGRLVRDAIAVLSVMAALEFFVCSMADYLGDVSRHLYTFQAMCDLLLLADLVWLAEAVGVEGRQIAKSADGDSWRHSRFPDRP